MKTPKIILICLLKFITMQVSAQTAHFIKEGEITYKKTVNMHAILKKSILPTDISRLAAYEQFKQTQPQFLELTSKLLFNSVNTAYLPDPATNFSGFGYFGPNPWYMQTNKVYTDARLDSSTTQKEILNQLFLVKDKKQTIRWKITDETREIAGFNCRRANGLIHDSIYIVAFYTNKIPIPGGPESFHGLPGMILGIALPYENVSWFATNVNETKNINGSFIPPTKGNILNNKELKNLIEKTLRSTNNFSESVLQGYIL